MRLWSVFWTSVRNSPPSSEPGFYQDKDKQHHTCSDKRLSVHTCRISHFSNNICSHSTKSLENPLRHSGLVSRYHNNRHSLANGTSDSKNHSCKNTGFCRRKHYAENATFLCGSKSQRTFIIAFRNTAER